MASIPRGICSHRSARASPSPAVSTTPQSFRSTSTRHRSSSVRPQDPTSSEHHERITMSDRKQRRFAWRRTATVVMAGAIALSAAGCASVDAGKNATGTVAPVAQDPKAPITVWVDATRQPMAEAFAKKYPSPAIKIVTIDQNAQGADSLQAKIALADKAGKGWPDVIWSSQTTD